MKLMELFDLTGQFALITGGGRGLGKQIAEVYAEMGCHLALCSRKKANCDEAAAELSAISLPKAIVKCRMNNKLKRLFNKL